MSIELEQAPRPRRDRHPDRHPGLPIAHQFPKLGELGTTAEVLELVTVRS
jgi:hypothetical protein